MTAKGRSAARCCWRVVLLASLASGLACGDRGPGVAVPPAGAGALGVAGTPVGAPAGTVGVVAAGSHSVAGSVAGAGAAGTAGVRVDAGAMDSAVVRQDAAQTDAARPGPDVAVVPVDLPSGATAMFPAPDTTVHCDDPPLRIAFDAEPTLGDRGQVHVWSEAQAGEPVLSMELGARAGQARRGGGEYQQGPPIYVDGNAVVFALPPGALIRGQRYYVTVEPGVLRGPTGPFVVDDEVTWRFEVADRPPAPAGLEVGLDGTAPFCSVQGAVDAVPDGNRAPTTIEIGPGTYYGIVRWIDKHQLTLRGLERKGTRIVGINNNNLNPSTRTRPLVIVESSADVTLENLTIHNLTPQGGSQAEALALIGCDRCVVRDADILSLQDTLLWMGRVYAENCLIEGNVDYVWGTGSAYFKNCELKTVGRGGYIVQSRNGRDESGYVFVDSRLTADPGIVDSVVLARIDASAYPYSNVAYIDCEMGPHISAAGWTVSGFGGGSLRFWEYGSRDASGAAISTTRRSGFSRQLTDAEAMELRDPAAVLGGWRP